MMVNTLEPVLAEHPFFRGLSQEDIKMLAGCASNAVFEAGEMIGREGDEADSFYLIRDGKVALEVYAPDRGQAVIQTLGAGEILGWSWLIPPYRWRFDARAVDRTRTISLNGKCVRNKCDENPRLGYDLLKSVAQVFTDRLLATRLQLLDIYGKRS